MPHGGDTTGRAVSFSHFDRIWEAPAEPLHFPQITDWLGRSLALPRGLARQEMRLLLDENMSDRRLGARLRAQGHDPVLATGVGLLSATDARVFIAAITQALPVLTRDSEDFTDLHDLIMAGGGHHSGVLVVRDPEQVRKLAGWGLTQNDRASFVGWSQSLISLGF